MGIVLVGTSYKCCPMEVRERLFFSKKRLKGALKSLVGFGGVNSAVILSTCNRVELYADANDAGGGILALKKFLSRYHGEEQFKLEPYLYSAAGKEAVSHLFCVAAGVDSQIVGESEILQQVRFAYGEAREAGAASGLLGEVFEGAISAGIKARERTGISDGNVSIATIAISLIKEKFGELKGRKVLIIGTGKISESVVGELGKENIRVAFVANRTREKALRLARHVGAEVAAFDCLRQKLSEVDIVISATASPHLILRKEDLQGAGKKPGLIMDFSVPKNVDPGIKDLGVSVYCLDDLGFAIEKNLGRRKLEIPVALKVLEGEVEKLWLAGHLGSGPVPVPLP